MKTATHGNGRGLNDLYILPDDSDEHARIAKYLRSIGISYMMRISDVEGQEWHGRMFMDVPFGEALEPGIREALQAKPQPAWIVTYTYRTDDGMTCSTPTHADFVFVEADDEPSARQKAIDAAYRKHMGGCSHVTVKTCRGQSGAEFAGAV